MLLHYVTTWLCAMCLCYYVSMLLCVYEWARCSQWPVCPLSCSVPWHVTSLAVAANNGGVISENGIAPGHGMRLEANKVLIQIDDRPRIPPPPRYTEQLGVLPTMMRAHGWCVRLLSGPLATTMGNPEPYRSAFCKPLSGGGQCCQQKQQEREGQLQLQTLTFLAQTI